MGYFLHIATVVNDRAVYDQMRATLASAGYDESRCRFTFFDNTSSNLHEPYSVIRQLAAEGDEPYVILCHQDLLFDDDTRFDVLRNIIEDLNKQDDRWAVAGDAGGDLHCVTSLYLTDPSGVWRSKNMPCRAQTLDENFLLFRRSHFPRPSPELSGFHFYGADICLSAIADGNTAYMVRFPVTHLSSGNCTSEAFRANRQSFMDVWEKELLVGLIMTICTYGIVSCNPIMRWLLERVQFAKMLQRFGLSIVVRPKIRFFRWRNRRQRK